MLYMTFHKILILLRRKMVKPVGIQDYAVFSRQNREAKIARRGLKRVKLRFCSCRVNSDNQKAYHLLVARSADFECFTLFAPFTKLALSAHRSRIPHSRYSLNLPLSFSLFYSPIHFRHCATATCHQSFTSRGTCSLQCTYPTCVTTSTTLYTE